MVRGCVCTAHSPDCRDIFNALCKVLTSTLSDGEGCDTDRCIVVTEHGGPGVFDVVTQVGAGTIDGVLWEFPNGEDSGRHTEVGVEGMCWIGCDINLGSAFARSTGPTGFCSVVCWEVEDPYS